MQYIETTWEKGEAVCFLGPGLTIIRPWEAWEGFKVRVLSTDKQQFL